MGLCCLAVIVLGAGMTVSQKHSTECNVPRMQDDRNDRHSRSTMVVLRPRGTAVIAWRGAENHLI